MLLLLAFVGAPFALADGPAAASTDERPYGSHIVTRFWIPGNADETPVLGIETPGRELALYVVWRSSWDGIFATDGGAGSPQLVVIPGTQALSDGRAYRLDVTLHGTTYTLTIDRKISFTAETLVPATKGRPVLEPGTLLGGEQTVHQVRARVDNANMAYETTFVREPELDGWTRFESKGEIDSAIESRTAFRVVPNGGGHWSEGVLELLDSKGPGVAYLHAPIPTGGRYVAEASYSVGASLLPSRGQAVLAGVSGPLDTPVIRWAVVMDRALDAEWHVYASTLYHQASDGTRTQLMPADTGRWHAVTAVVDENAGTLTIRIDSGLRPTLEHTFLSQDLGQVERIAVGDVSNDLVETLTHLPGRSWLGMYDDLAVYPEVGG